jgi:hypothetical protein
MINSKLLLGITFIGVGVFYYIFLPIDKIIDIIKDEYILLSITFCMFGVYLYFKYILKDKLIHPFIPNLNHVDIKSSVIFFLIFEIIDFYTEDGFIGMISLWFMYWVFGVLIYFLTHNINYYKNYKAYQSVL